MKSLARMYVWWPGIAKDIESTIRHCTQCQLYQSGLAEHAVQIVKKGLKKITQGSIRDCLAEILLSYRLTPQSTTGMSPYNVEKSG